MSDLINFPDATRMSTPDSLIQLQGAIDEDRQDARASLARSWRFLENVKAYQRGEGPLPDELEFLQWREDLRLSLEPPAPLGGAPVSGQSRPASPEPEASIP
jgi:hypothetical protein